MGMFTLYTESLPWMKGFGTMMANLCVTYQQLMEHCNLSNDNLWNRGSKVLVLKQNIVRCYSNLKLNIPTRNCIRSLCSQVLHK